MNTETLIYCTVKTSFLTFKITKRGLTDWFCKNQCGQMSCYSAHNHIYNKRYVYKYVNFVTGFRELRQESFELSAIFKFC